MNDSRELEFATIGEICDVSDDIGRTAPDAALRYLDKFRGRDDFFPWGDFFALRNMERGVDVASTPAERDSRLSALRVAAFSFFDAAPAHQPAWPIVLRVAHYTVEYRTIVARIFEQLEYVSSLCEPWLAMTVVECLLNVSPGEGARVAHKAVLGGLLTAEAVSGVVRLSSFLTQLRDALASQSPSPIWGIEFGAGAIFRRAPAGQALVNISRLQLAHGDDWMLPLSAPFFTALFAMFEWQRPVFEEVFLNNWATMSMDDVVHSLFVQLIQTHLPHQPMTPPKPLRLRSARPRPGELWVRAGNGQLWALRSYIEKPEATCRAARDVAAAMQTGQIDMLFSRVANDPWWPRCDQLANVARIALNAGWYAPPETAEEVFRDWAERYRSALERGHLLSAHAHIYSSLVPLLPALKTKDLSHFVIGDFLTRMDGASLVFATAFAAQIETQYKSGHVDALWAATGVIGRLKQLVCVEAPVSVWPHRPHADWRSSFRALVESCEATIRATRATVFLAACGGYGLPLVEEIHRRTGVMCLYPGHIANMLFGIYTDDCQRHAFYFENKSLPYWVNGSLADSCPEIASVDHGRYVVSSSPAGRSLLGKSNGSTR